MVLAFIGQTKKRLTFNYFFLIFIQTIRLIDAKSEVSEEARGEEALGQAR